MMRSLRSLTLIVSAGAFIGISAWYLLQSSNDPLINLLYGGDNPELAHVYFAIVLKKHDLREADFAGPVVFKQDNGIYTYTWHKNASKAFIYIAPNADEACFLGDLNTKGPSCVTSEDWDRYRSVH